MPKNVRLDRAGLREVLKSAPVAAAINDRAHVVFSNVGAVVAHDGQVVPVEVTPYTTDRAAASVTLLHAAGLGLQAKHGTLTKAASAAGLELGRRK